MTVLLGGDACPLALNVQYLKAPIGDVVATLADIWAPVEATRLEMPLSEALEALLPFEAGWTRMLAAEAGKWTAVINNFVNGGDSTAPGPAVAAQLGVQCVIAENAPCYGPGHAATQLFVQRPSDKRWGYSRVLSAHATDGRWRWDESGSPFSFEETERYAARRKRDRFDRDMLLRYLNALGISTNDDEYSQATLVQCIVDWPRREESLAEAKAAFGL